MPERRFASIASDEPEQGVINMSPTNAVPLPSVSSPHASHAASPGQIQGGEHLSGHISSPPHAVSSGFTSRPSVVASDGMVEHVLITPRTSTHVDDVLFYGTVTPSRSINGSLSQQRPANMGSALLRFRYDVVPWIDSNNGNSAFGPAMMALARNSTVISDCIVYCVRLWDGNVGSPNATSCDSNARHGLLDRLSQAAAPEADVGCALLAISDVFCISPLEWSSTLARPVRSCAEEILKSRAIGFMIEPLETLLRLHLKIGKVPPISVACWVY